MCLRVEAHLPVGVIDQWKGHGKIVGEIEANSEQDALWRLEKWIRQKGKTIISIVDAEEDTDMPGFETEGGHKYVISPQAALSAAESTWEPLIFGVQKHDAKKAGLHYDLRLEYRGVLK